MNFNSHFGAYYRASNGAEDEYYAGLSITNLNQPKLKIDKGEGKEHSFLRRHYYLTGAYYYSFRSLWDISPGFIMMSDGVTNQYTFHARAIYKKQFWGGIVGRLASLESIAPIVGVNLPMGIGVGLSYDITLGKFASYNNGSLEFYLRYCFNIESDKGPSSYKSVRFL